MTDAATQPPAPWHRRARQALGASIKLRLVFVFLLLALAMGATFLGGAQKAFSIGWRDAARPLLMDYVDRLAADITADGLPSVQRATAITQRLPITVRIQGPRVNWDSHPEQDHPEWLHERPARPDWPNRAERRQRGAQWNHEGWDGEQDWARMFTRPTADGHRITFGLNDQAFEQRPRFVWFTLAALLVLTALAYAYMRRLLRPLDDIRQGAQRFGAGEFGQPIPVQRPQRPDELGQLAATINTMGQDIQQMLDAKRALLLAISHELRSPLTRARLNTELLPESGEVVPQREALLRDLQEMANLITNLLESERLATKHAALQREPVQLEALAREVIADLQVRHPSAVNITVHAAPDLPNLALDATRMRLLLRNLLDNALRHSSAAPRAPELHLKTVAGQGIEIEVRDHGPGVAEDQLPHLAEPFYRPDTARTRHAGGVGLGLYLCKLVSQAHGGRCAVRNAQPGLAVTVTLPGA